MNKTKRPIVSVTAADCKFDYIRGTGSGGQKKNKTNSAVRCTHKDSRAVGYCESSRKQSDNKKTAFQRMAETKKFRDWLHIEVSRRTGELAEIEREVQRQMNLIRVEVKDERGLWTEVDKKQELNHEED